MELHEAALLFLKKAGEDLHAARVLSHDATISTAIVGFHCQQSIEKALKAVLLEKNVYFPRTHNLTYLAGLFVQAGLVLPLTTEQIAEFNAFAVDFRYADLDESIAFDRQMALDMAQTAYAWAGTQISPP